MRIIGFLLFLLSSPVALTDNIQKWTDSSGKIHYGDISPPAEAGNRQQIEIHDSFDESSYKAAMKRNTALYKEVKQIEKRERARAKAADKRLDDYFLSLDKKSKKLEKIRLKKRRLRDSERKRASIKVKRIKSTGSTKKRATRGLN